MLALGVFVALVGPPPAPATVPDPPVQWTAPPGCPDVQVVSDRIADLLGRQVESGEIELRGTITAVASGWSLELVTRVGELQDERTLGANDCSVLADAAALVAVVMLDPVLAAATIETRAAAAAAVTEEVKPKSTPAPPKLPQAVKKTAEPRPKTKPRRWDRPPPRKLARGEPPGTWLRLRGGGEFGAVPQGTGGFEIAFAIGSDRLRGEVTGAYFIGRPTNDGSARVHLGAATPRVCGMIAAGPIDVPLCAGFELGGMVAQSDAPGISTQTRFWLAAQAEPGIRWAFAKRVSLFIGVQAFVPIVFPVFQLAGPMGSDVVHRPAPAGLRGLAGLEFRLLGTERGR